MPRRRSLVNVTRLGTGLALLLLTVSACSSGESKDAGPMPPMPAQTASPAVSDQGTGSSSDGLTSCAEVYSPSAVAARAFAFDGVVVRVGPSVSDRGDSANLGLPGVTFEVREWFVGGPADSVTVDMQLPPDEFPVGSRLLVSGEARWGGGPLDYPIAWSCGFTFAYDSGEAAAWRRAATT